MIILATSLILVTSQYDKGYDKGYKAGYCYNTPNCIEPISPIVPIPRMNESSDSYQDGYNRGFTDGKKKKKEDN